MRKQTKMSDKKLWRRSQTLIEELRKEAASVPFESRTTEMMMERSRVVLGTFEQLHQMGLPLPFGMTTKKDIAARIMSRARGQYRRPLDLPPDVYMFSMTGNALLNEIVSSWEKLFTWFPMGSVWVDTRSATTKRGLGIYLSVITDTRIAQSQIRHSRFRIRYYRERGWTSQVVKDEYVNMGYAVENFRRVLPEIQQGAFLERGWTIRKFSTKTGRFRLSRASKLCSFFDFDDMVNYVLVGQSMNEFVEQVRKLGVE